jgi:hypothetical protein
MLEYNEQLEDVYTSIVVHHSASTHNKWPTRIQENHVSRWFDDIWYHFFIGQNGDMYQWRELIYIWADAWELKKANAITKKHKWGKKQMKSIQRDMSSISLRSWFWENMSRVGWFVYEQGTK